MGGAWRARDRRLLFRAAAVAAVAGLVVLASGGVAAAHSRLVGSEPADGATVQVAPASVELKFSQRLGAGLAVVVVTGPDGSPVPVHPATVDGPTVVVQLGALPAAGRYQVGYRVVSADGHPVSGEIGFTVASGPTTSPTNTPSSAAAPAGLAPTASSQVPGRPAPAAVTTASGGGANGWIAVVIVAGVVLAGAGTWIGVRQRGRGRS